LRELEGVGVYILGEFEVYLARCLHDSQVARHMSSVCGVPEVFFLERTASHSYDDVQAHPIAFPYEAAERICDVLSSFDRSRMPAVTDNLGSLSIWYRFALLNVHHETGRNGTNLCFEPCETWWVSK